MHLYSTYRNLTPKTHQPGEKRIEVDISSRLKLNSWALRDWYHAMTWPLHCDHSASDETWHEIWHERWHQTWHQTISNMASESDMAWAGLRMVRLPAWAAKSRNCCSLISSSRTSQTSKIGQAMKKAWENPNKAWSNMFEAFIVTCMAIGHVWLHNLFVYRVYAPKEGRRVTLVYCDLGVVWLSYTKFGKLYHTT